MESEARRIDKFKAASGDETVYVVEIWQELTNIGRHGQAKPEWKSGLKEARLENGTVLSTIDDETFQIVSNGTIIRKISD